MYRKKTASNYPNPNPTPSPVHMPPEQDPIEGPYLDSSFDPEGSYTGVPKSPAEHPVQDADDL